ncbi:hypothetical protein JXL19_11340, partial [bacterium]|nr:hypothetical protein [bacterium]
MLAGYFAGSALNSYGACPCTDTPVINTDLLDRFFVLSRFGTSNTPYGQNVIFGIPSQYNLASGFGLFNQQTGTYGWQNSLFGLNRFASSYGQYGIPNISGI